MRSWTCIFLHTRPSESTLYRRANAVAELIKLATLTEMRHEFVTSVRIVFRMFEREERDGLFESVCSVERADRSIRINKGGVRWVPWEVSFHRIPKTAIVYHALKLIEQSYRSGHLRYFRKITAKSIKLSVETFCGAVKGRVNHLSSRPICGGLVTAARVSCRLALHRQVK